MTTAEQFRDAFTHPAAREVSVAGVPWPAYKLLALAVGMIAFLTLAIVTTSAAVAVLGGAAAATATWLVCELRRRTR